MSNSDGLGEERGRGTRKTPQICMVLPFRIASANFGPLNLLIVVILLFSSL